MDYYSSTISRDPNSEYDMIREMAAETLQQAFRRYKECQPAIKIKRVTSEEKIIMELAADTIQQGLKQMYYFSMTY